MAAKAHEEREEKASSSNSIMAEFYVLENTYIAVKDERTLNRLLDTPDASMWLPSRDIKPKPTTEQEASHATDYNIFKEKGLDSDGIRILGEKKPTLETKLEPQIGTEDDIELVPE